MSQAKSVLLIAVLITGTASVSRGQCPGAEPPTGSSCAPRVISGAPGVHEVVMDVTAAGAGFQTACGFNLGAVVWFSVTPDVTGPLTFTTCTPGTQYDTILQVWTDTGDCEFPQRLDDLCVDDTTSGACTNACSPIPRASSVTFHAVAGTTYLFEVGSFDNNSAGCTLCLGVRVIICGADDTPPIVGISSPVGLSCVCNPVQIVGSAFDPEDTFESYTLEVRPATSSTWTPVSSSTVQGVSVLLGEWNAAGSPQGYHVLRLTARNVCGLTSTAVQVVWLGTQFDTVRIDSPADGTVVGGLVCFDGTVSDNACFSSFTVDFRPELGGAWSPVTTVLNDKARINEQFARWDTIGDGMPDGNYTIRVTGTDACGNPKTAVLNTLTVDNSLPEATILEPPDCTIVEGVVPIVGTATDANLDNWVLQYTGDGGHTWTNIAPPSSTPVIASLLANWDTTGLNRCAYTIRLVVTDRANVNCNGAIRNRSEYTASTNVGDPCPPGADAMSTVGLGILALLLLGTGTIAMRRRRLAAGW